MLWNWNQGKCGVCGDSITDPTPRLHETGGKFGNKIITATYETGDVIDVEIVVNTNHLGFFEIKLCVVEDDSEETNECFDKHPLAVLSGPGQRRGEAAGGRVLVVSNITCRATGLRKDVTDQWCEDNCVLDLHNCPTIYCRCTIDVIDEEEPVRSPEVSTEPTTTQEEEGEEEETDVVCEALSPGYKDVPGISKFCRKSCLETIPAFCPPHICQCSGQSDQALQSARTESRDCVAVGEFSQDPNMATFCQISCTHPSPHCPPDICQCNFIIPTPVSEAPPSPSPPTATSTTIWWRPETTKTTASHTTPKWWKFTTATNKPVQPSPTVINLNEIPASYTVPTGSVIYSIEVAELQAEQFKYRLETSHRRPGRIQYRVALPSGVRCERCVLQWTYVTGNTWGTCPHGESRLGCGPQETFRNCADVRIVGPGQARNLTETGDRKQLYQLNTLGELEPLTVDWAICVSTTPEYSDLSCMKDCFRYPPKCNFSKCRCLTTCESVGPFSSVFGSTEWCNMNCLRYPSQCSAEKCRCH